MLIGLTGYAGTGKDTVADWLCANKQFVKLRFADTLKMVVATLFDWPQSSLEDRTFKEHVDSRWGISPRQAMQWLGTEGLREGMPNTYQDMFNTVGRNFWVKRFLADAQTFTGYDIVVPDCRFQNEVDAIRDQGGIVYQVIRDSHEPQGEVHASERINQLQGVASYIDNNGSIDDLYHNLSVIFTERRIFNETSSQQ